MDLKMKIIDGNELAAELTTKLSLRVGKLAFRPLFCDCFVGNDPVSNIYVNIKEKKALEIGLDFKLEQFDESIDSKALIDKLLKIQEQKNLSGLIVQLPLPKHIDRNQILASIEKEVDVDVLNPIHAQEFYHNKAKLTPPTASAVIFLLESLNLELDEKKFLVIGQGDLVGKPVTFLLKQKGFQVLTADRTTQGLEALTKQADVIITATGQPNLLKGEMFKPGTIVIDAGTSELNGGITGDVDMETSLEHIRNIAAVPGGVGPVTVAKLLENVVAVAENK